MTEKQYEFKTETNTHTSESDSDDDKDFELTVDLMLNDFDDEGTLDEEEETETSDRAEELSCLIAEGDLPLDQLLCRYNLPSDFVENPKEPMEFNPTPQNRRMLLLRSGLRDGGGSSDDESAPILNWKKHTNVGPEYQAEVDEAVKGSDDYDLREYGTLLWSPTRLSEKFVIRFLKNLLMSSKLPDLVPDDEDALLLLSSLDYDVNKALSQWKTFQERNQPLRFTAEECTAFEEGLAEYGKNFLLLQKNKLRQRKVAELVEFYYFWKKTERHDVFVSQCKPDKKGLGNKAFNTDLMERCCDEFENQISHNNTSPTSHLQNIANDSLRKTDGSESNMQKS